MACPPPSSFPSEGILAGLGGEPSGAGSEPQRAQEASHSLLQLHWAQTPDFLHGSVSDYGGGWEERGFRLWEHMELKATCVPFAGRPAPHPEWTFPPR